MDKKIFEDLFVLELANNHLGRLSRGKKIIAEHSHIAKMNHVRAAIKLQFRDPDDFIHQDFKYHDAIRYIKKTRTTMLTKEDYKTLVTFIKACGLIPMATPFDENSVDLCAQFNLPILKIASSSINDWPLIEKIASLKRPVIVSTGGSSVKAIDDVVAFFKNRHIPLAINHCVSIYPTDERELELNQIDFLKTRYPDHTIGFSTHEHQDWSASIMMAYAKGARTFERHIDVTEEGVTVSPYCSLPHQIDTWFKAYKKAVEMCGTPGTQKRNIPEKEIRYLDQLMRGIYAKRDLPKGHKLNSQAMNKDIYAAIPLQAGQISCRELKTGGVLMKDIKKDRPLMIDEIDCAYARDPHLRQFIYDRGLKNALKD